MNQWKDWKDACVNHWPSDRQFSESKTQWTNARVNLQGDESVNQWLGEWMSPCEHNESANQWSNESINERMDEWTKMGELWWVSLARILVKCCRPRPGPTLCASSHTSQEPYYVRNYREHAARQDHGSHSQNAHGQSTKALAISRENLREKHQKPD